MDTKIQADSNQKIKLKLCDHLNLVGFIVFATHRNEQDYYIVKLELK